jgi:hypothetical protein
MTWRLNQVRYLNVTIVPELKLDPELLAEHAEISSSGTRVVRSCH